MFLPQINKPGQLGLSTKGDADVVSHPHPPIPAQGTPASGTGRLAAQEPNAPASEASDEPGT